MSWAEVLRNPFRTDVILYVYNCKESKYSEQLEVFVKPLSALSTTIVVYTPLY